MNLIPPASTPLNQHSLMALESWLHELGAERSKADPCKWTWLRPNWSVELLMQEDKLQVTWQQNGKQSHCSFPYGLSRSDVESAILDGP